MRFFVTAFVAVFGIGMFAIAALAWDRRRQLSGVQASDGEPPNAARLPISSANRRYLPYIVIAVALVIGTGMVIGACAGLLRF